MAHLQSGMECLWCFVALGVSTDSKEVNFRPEPFKSFSSFGHLFLSQLRLLVQCHSACGVCAGWRVVV